MQRAILILTVLLFYIQSCGQSKDSLKKDLMTESLQDIMKTQKSLIPKDIEDFTAYFKPELIDSFFQYIKQEKYDKIYENTDDFAKKVQSKSDSYEYLKLIKLKYGRINSYKPKAYSIQSDLISHKRVANTTYLVEFDKIKANIMASFVVVDSNNIKLRTFQITPNDYTQIEEFDSLTKPIFEYLKIKDALGLYHSTSKRFQDYTLLADFESSSRELFKMDYTSHKLYQHQIGIIKGQTMYYLTYEIVDSSNQIGYLVFTFTETDQKFFLEGLRFKRKNE